MAQKLFDMLKERGFVKDMTHPEQIKDALDGTKKITFYLGVDPTADSLHIGHFFALRMFRHLQNAGHKGILIIGGATAMVGDPSGRSDMRAMITAEQIAHNIAEVKELARRFILPETEIMDNADWLNKFNYVDFLRHVGAHFNMNTMLAADAYKQRREEGGLTFLEMGYMPMQAYDFVHLNKEHGCTMQIGGSDQWGNIVAGCELYRKMNIGKNAPDILGLTSPLLMTVDGTKMGKTAKGTLWVAREKTTPFDFYQYFYNTPDENTMLLLSLFTDIPMPEIKEMCVSDIIAAKKRMAYEITKLIHGEQLADDAVAAAQSLFAGGAQSDAVPTFVFDAKESLEKYGFPPGATVCEENIQITVFLVIVGLAKSNSEARRTIEQGGLAIDDEKVTDPMSFVTVTSGKTIMLQKGKKTFLRVIIK